MEFLFRIILTKGARGSQVVKVLDYKAGDSGFEAR
jgi:hypothetical protein